MLYKTESVTILRLANIDDDGYDLNKEQVLIRFRDDTRAVVIRSELSLEPVKVPVMEVVPEPIIEPVIEPVTQPSTIAESAVLMSS